MDEGGSALEEGGDEKGSELRARLRELTRPGWLASDPIRGPGIREYLGWLSLELALLSIEEEIYM